MCVCVCVCMWRLWNCYELKQASTQSSIARTDFNLPSPVVFLYQTIIYDIYISVYKNDKNYENDPTICV